MENRKSNMEEEHVPAGKPRKAHGRRKPGHSLRRDKTGKTAQRGRKSCAAGNTSSYRLSCWCFLAVLCLIFAPSGDSGETAAGGSGFNVNVPNSTTVQLEGNKTDVYERQQARREKDRRMQSLSDLAGRLLEGKKGADSIPSPDGEHTAVGGHLRADRRAVGELLRNSASDNRRSGTKKVEELSRRLEEAEAENRRTDPARR